MKNDALKTLALRAKNRLLHKGLREHYSNAKIKVVENRDMEFTTRVRDVLDKEDAMTNPLKYLMDEQRLMKMDSRARERYLLDMIDKYQEVKRELSRQNNVC